MSFGFAMTSLIHCRKPYYEKLLILYGISTNVYLFMVGKNCYKTWKSNNMPDKRCHKLNTEEFQYSYDLSDSISEGKIPDFSSISWA